MRRAAPLPVMKALPLDVRLMNHLAAAFLLVFAAMSLSAALGWLWWSGKQRGGGHAHHHDHGGSSRSEQILKVCAAIAAAWLLGGLGAAALPGVQASTGG